MGGKRRLAPSILPWIEACPHTCYVEPFIGMGGMFLSRRQAAAVEVINDISRDVATFFRVVQRHYVPFLDYMRFQVTSRAAFDRLVNTDPITLTDIERAGRFLYLQACAFGGKSRARSFGVSPSGFHGFDLSRVGPLLDALHDRLSGIVVECLPYGDILQRWDAPNTLFYLDPPYWDCETDYGKGVFAREDFSRLAEILAAIEGRFVLSINDTPGVREAFRNFNFAVLDHTYSIASTGPTAVQELLYYGPPGREWGLSGVQGALL